MWPTVGRWEGRRIPHSAVARAQVYWAVSHYFSRKQCAYNVSVRVFRVRAKSCSPLVFQYRWSIVFDPVFLWVTLSCTCSCLPCHFLHPDYNWYLVGSCRPLNLTFTYLRAIWISIFEHSMQCIVFLVIVTRTIDDEEEEDTNGWCSIRGQQDNFAARLCHFLLIVVNVTHCQMNVCNA